MSADSNAPAAAKRRPRLAIAAAALAWAPIGFAGGLALGARALGLVDGASLLACGAAGAGVAAVVLAAAAAHLPVAVARIATVGAAAVSFGILVFLVRDFSATRAAQAEALAAAYARLTPFKLRIESTRSGRQPFSTLMFDSASRSYTAVRPGGWRCRGRASQEDAVTFQRLAAELDQQRGEEPGKCATRWVLDDGAGESPQALPNGRCATGTPLLAAADAMIERTARRASCRRAEGTE